jgi:hypothetical protein
LIYEREDDDVYCASDASEALLSGPDYAKAFGEMDDTVCGGGADKVNLAPSTDQIFGNEANHKLTGDTRTDR